MRLSSRIDVFLPGDTIERAPQLWERLVALWAPVDLRTDRVRDRLEAAAFVYEMRTALDALGIDDARSLVVDGTTVFHDARGVTGDLPDLVLALSDHVSLFGSGSQELRLSVEHREAGLAFVVEAVVTAEHGRDAPSARIDVSAKLADFDPRPGESADDYRGRVEPLATDPKLAKTVRLQFGAFVARLEEALRRAFADTRIEAGEDTLDAALGDTAPREPARDEPDDGTTARPWRPRPTPDGSGDTAAPTRNFTLSAGARVAALIAGPPPYAVRQRRIEDLVEEVVAVLCEIEREGGKDVPIAVVRRLEEANALVRQHNKYYPVERNLPIDAATGQLVEMGDPWRPKPAITLDELRHEARARLAGR